MRTNRMKTEYQQRVRSCVDDIYNLTNGKEQKEGFYKYRKDKLFGDCGSALLKLKVVENNGTKANVIYSWSGEKPTEALYNMVYDIVGEMRTGHKSITAKTETPAMAAVAVPKPVKVTVNPEIELKELTDMQLWTELKSRGWIISDNKLCKQVFLL